MTSCQELSEEEKKKILSIFQFEDKNNVETLVDKPSKDVINKKPDAKKEIEGGTRNTHGYHSNVIMPVIPNWSTPSYIYSYNHPIVVHTGILRLKIPNIIWEELFAVANSEIVQNIINHNSFEIQSSRMCTDYVLFGKHFSKERDLINNNDEQKLNKFYNKFPNGTKMDDNTWYSDKKIPSFLKQVIANTLMFIKVELLGSGYLTDDKELHYPIVGFLRNKESGYHHAA